MEIQKRLLEIWNRDYINELPEIIKQRGFNYSINQEPKDILITGINPSFRKGDNNGNVCFDFKITPAPARIPSCGILNTSI